MHLSSTRRFLGLIVLSAVASLPAPSAQAGVLFYNGDANGLDSLINENNVPINTGSGYVIQTALVYQNFVVPTGQTWTITSVYSNDAMAYYQAATTATWEIRSGVSDGNGGTLLYNGDSSATQVATGTTVGGLNEYTVTANVTSSSVVLTAGEYWLAVAPDSQGYYGDQSYVATTSGTNSVGQLPTDSGNTYLSYTYPTSVSFESAQAFMGSSTPENFSMGVVGTFTVMVPEPSSFVLATMGLFGSSILLRRRSKTQSS